MFPLYNDVGILADKPESPLSGNKGLKLGPHVHAALQSKQNGLIGFGSAYSNFLMSLALDCHRVGLQSIGIISGEELARRPLNPVLAIAKACGMQLHFVSRAQYRLRHSPEYIVQLQAQHPGFSVVPEGGSTLAAATACGELIRQYREATGINTQWLVAAGTGATSAGVAAAMSPTQQALVISVTNDTNVPAAIKQQAQAIWRKQNAVVSHCDNELTQRITILPCKRPPRFGKLDRELCRIVSECHDATGILLDPVYTVRVLQTFSQWRSVNNACDVFPVLIHTGGLSGWLAQPGVVHQWLGSATVQAIEKVCDTYRQLPDNASEYC